MGFVHIKQMDPAMVRSRRRDPRVRPGRGGHGRVSSRPASLQHPIHVVEALSGLDAELFVVVEQDMYPVDFDKPEPIARRTRDYLRGVGVDG